jgi:hypothetical protein
MSTDFKDDTISSTTVDFPDADPPAIAIINGFILSTPYNYIIRKVA